jgi:hypothetical protein
VKPRILEAVAAAILLEAWILAAQTIPALPSRVATHFNVAGAPDAYDSPGALWVLPIMVTVVYLIVTSTQFIPPRWISYPVRVTDQNREGVYALGREMLPAIKICAMLTLFGVEWGGFDASTRGAMGPYFMTAIFVPAALIAAVLIYYSIRMRSI